MQNPQTAIEYYKSNVQRYKALKEIVNNQSGPNTNLLNLVNEAKAIKNNLDKFYLKYYKFFFENQNRKKEFNFEKYTFEFYEDKDFFRKHNNSALDSDMSINNPFFDTNTGLINTLEIKYMLENTDFDFSTIQNRYVNDKKTFNNNPNDIKFYSGPNLNKQSFKSEEQNILTNNQNNFYFNTNNNANQYAFSKDNFAKEEEFYQQNIYFSSKQENDRFLSPNSYLALKKQNHYNIHNSRQFTKFENKAEYDEYVQDKINFEKKMKVTNKEMALPLENTTRNPHYIQNHNPNEFLDDKKHNLVKSIIEQTENETLDSFSNKKKVGRPKKNSKEISNFVKEDLKKGKKSKKNKPVETEKIIKNKNKTLKSKKNSSSKEFDHTEKKPIKKNMHKDQSKANKTKDSNFLENKQHIHINEYYQNNRHNMQKQAGNVNNFDLKQKNNITDQNDIKNIKDNSKNIQFLNNNTINLIQNINHDQYHTSFVPNKNFFDTNNLNSQFQNKKNTMSFSLNTKSSNTESKFNNPDKKMNPHFQNQHTNQTLMSKNNTNNFKSTSKSIDFTNQTNNPEHILPTQSFYNNYHQNQIPPVLYDNQNINMQDQQNFYVQNDNNYLYHNENLQPPPNFYNQNMYINQMQNNYLQKNQHNFSFMQQNENPNFNYSTQGFKPYYNTDFNLQNHQYDNNDFLHEKNSTMPLKQKPARQVYDINNYEIKKSPEDLNIIQKNQNKNIKNSFKDSKGQEHANIRFKDVAKPKQSHTYNFMHADDKLAQKNTNKKDYFDAKLNIRGKDYKIDGKNHDSILQNCINDAKNNCRKNTEQAYEEISFFDDPAMLQPKFNLKNELKKEKAIDEIFVNHKLSEETRNLITDMCDLFIEKTCYSACAISKNEGKKVLESFDVKKAMKIEYNIEFPDLFWKRKFDSDIEHEKKISCIEKELKRRK
ncbi:hypothetical protein GVAV_002587 [Gurleya vavrai]